MKVVDSNSISNSFGISNVELDELLFVNGGNAGSTNNPEASSGKNQIYIPNCSQYSDTLDIFNIPQLSGNIIYNFPPDDLSDSHISSITEGIDVQYLPAETTSAKNTPSSRK